MKKIEIIRGTTNAFNITVLDANDNPYILADGEELLFGVKKKHEDESHVILKAITSGENGVYIVELEPEDTVNLDIGNYVFDVNLETGEDFYNVIESSPFFIKANVTRWGDEG